ncbi:MAG: hypothetical protein GY749_13825 [Desulfobacteraceae bacterium]|nr:hypothetical protein [Desulfobacteraceae bacterium]
MMFTNNQKIQKIYVSNDNLAQFECPKCSKSKITDVSNYKSYHKAVKIKVRCVCGHSHSVLLERRRHFRKKVNMPGACIWGENEDEIKIPMTVIDLSCYGLRCEMTGSGSLDIDDELLVEFRPVKKKEVWVRRDIIVRNITDFHIGAEFNCKIDVDFLYSEPSMYTFPSQFWVVLP